MKNLDKCVIIGTIVLAIIFVIVSMNQSEDAKNPLEDLESVLEHCKQIHESYLAEYNIDILKAQHIPLKEFVDNYNSTDTSLLKYTTVIDNIILCEQYVNWSIIEYESGFPDMAKNSLQTASNHYLIAYEEYQSIEV